LPCHIFSCAAQADTRYGHWRAVCVHAQLGLSSPEPASRESPTFGCWKAERLFLLARRHRTDRDGAVGILLHRSGTVSVKTWSQEALQPVQRPEDELLNAKRLAAVW
jgi:hypothetical protein